MVIHGGLPDVSRRFRSPIRNGTNICQRVHRTVGLLQLRNMRKHRNKINGIGKDIEFLIGLLSDVRRQQCNPVIVSKQHVQLPYLRKRSRGRRFRGNQGYAQQCHNGLGTVKKDADVVPKINATADS